MSELLKLLEDNRKIIDYFFEVNLKSQNPLKDKIISAMKYSTIGSGKKIRGFLVYETARLILELNKKEMSKSKKKEIIIAASSIEAMHSYSLIHDDLPSMDNSDMRRGKQSTHIKFDEATAILAGDALQSWSFELISNKKNISGSKCRSKLIHILSKSTGFKGMVAGQQAEIDLQFRKMSKDQIHWIQKKKTGELIKCAVMFGCLLSNATKTQMKSLIKFSEYLGEAFQIKDDLLDLKGDIEILGKPTGQDFLNEKQNFVTLLGEHIAKEKCVDITEKAIKSLNIFGKKAKNLVLLAKYSQNREY